PRASSAPLRPRPASARAAGAPAGPLPTTATSNMVVIKLAAMRKLAPLAAPVLILLSTAGACRVQQPVQGGAGAGAPMNMTAMDSVDERTSLAAHDAMSGPMTPDP